MGKMLACCVGAPGFGPWEVKFWLHQQNPSWMSFGCDVKLAVPCARVYAGQAKDATHGVNVQHVVGSCSLLSPHQSTLMSGKNFA